MKFVTELDISLATLLVLLLVLLLCLVDLVLCSL